MLFNQLTDQKSDSQSQAGVTSLLDGKTLPAVFCKRVTLSADERVFLVKREGSYRPVQWSKVHSESLGLFETLRKLGVAKGDRVAILSNSRPEWFVADITAQTLGAVTVPIYQSGTPQDIAYVLKHSGASVVFAEDRSQGLKLEQAFKSLDTIPQVIYFDAPGSEGPVPGLAYSEAIQASDPAAAARDQRETAQSLEPEMLASIVYTSGTTGLPKGARLLHSCLAAEVRSIAQEVTLYQSDLTLAFLPFAHVLGRVESLLPLVSGISVAFAESVATVAANMEEVRPTILMSVPRIYEKIYAKIQADVESSPALKKRLFAWSVETGREVARLRADKQPVPLALGLKHKAADQLVFSKVRQKLGGRLRFTVSGGAPLSRDVCEFFHACGVKVLEGYGLTETCAAIAVNRPDDYRFGTVGRPLAWTHFRIADDGEIQVKGPAVFAGYYEDPESTKQAHSEDGWFCTGDIGEFDERGFLKITDRKKEIIVTSGGKNVAPQKLENRLKQIPLVSQALVYGDQRKYLVALVTLVEADAKRWLREKGHSSSVPLHEHPAIQTHLQEHIREMNKELASYESVKRFKVLESDFTMESGELTPSLKLKRKIITGRHQDTLDALYR